MVIFIIFRMEQLRQQNTKAKTINRILGADNIPSRLEKYFKKQKKRMKIEMIKKKRTLMRYDILTIFMSQ